MYRQFLARIEKRSIAQADDSDQMIARNCKILEGSGGVFEVIQRTQ